LLFLRRTEPLAGEVLAQATLASWAPVFFRNESGWANVLGAPWEYHGDPRADLDLVLSHADELVGSRIASWAGLHGLRRIWVVPHSRLALVPWWALPALRDLDVRTAPALALLPRRRGVASLRGRAVVVGDPTSDLPIARAEASAVRARLETAGIHSHQLLEEEATEDAIETTLDGSRILHFSGHGMSELTDASRSALHVQPVPALAGPAGAILVNELAARAQWRTRSDGLQEAEVEPRAAGLPSTVRLVEETLTGNATLRHLEYAPTGTLLAAYVDGRLIRLAELWSAGDLAVSSALRGVRLAVLSACQSGGGALELDPDELELGPDEFAGLPAALTLAGVRTVVCTAWKVDDALAALAVDLLWEELCRDPGRTVDLGATVSDLRRRLAVMPTAEATARLEGLRLAAPSPRARFLLEARQARILEGPSRPFAHPYDWAPLFVLGEPLVTWRTR
jgi:CHAT domain-containing protein